MFYACMERIDSKYLTYKTPQNKQGLKFNQNPATDFTKYLIKPQGSSNNTKLKIFYTNDWHGQTDNLGGILGASLHFDSTTKGQKLDTLKLIAGDSWSGANTKKNNLILNLMNYMGFDACALGNHEFDAGTQAMLDTVNNSTNTKFVSANIQTTGGNKLKGIESSFIKEENGNKYGVIGLSPLDLKTVVAEEKVSDIDVHNFDNTVKSAQQEIDNMRAQG